MPNENTDSRGILYAVREIQNDISLQTAKPLNLFSLYLLYRFQLLPWMSVLYSYVSYHSGRY